MEGGGGGYINSTGVLQEQQRNLCMRIEETLLCVDIDPHSSNNTGKLDIYFCVDPQNTPGVNVLYSA